MSGVLKGWQWAKPDQDLRRFGFASSLVIVVTIAFDRRRRKVLQRRRRRQSNSIIFRAIVVTISRIWCEYIRPSRSYRGYWSNWTWTLGDWVVQVSSILWQFSTSNEIPSQAMIIPREFYVWDETGSRDLQQKGSTPYCSVGGAVATWSLKLEA